MDSCFEDLDLWQEFVDLGRHFFFLIGWPARICDRSKEGIMNDFITILIMFWLGIHEKIA